MQLKCIEQKTSNKHIEQIKSVFLALVITAGTVMWIMSAFSLDIGGAGRFTGGLVRLWNGVCDCIGKSDYILLTQYQGASEGSALFVFFAVLMFTIVNYAIIRFGKPWLLLIYVIPLFSAIAAFDIEPSVYASVIFVLVLVVASLKCLSGDNSSLWSCAAVVLIIVTITAAAVLITEGEYHHKGILYDVSSEVNETAERIKYGRNIRGDGSLQPEDFRYNETALKVTMEKPKSMYLKGFTGSVYEDGKWGHLACENYYEEKDLMYWLHKKDFSGMNQVYKVTELMGKKGEENKIRSINTGASRKYIYYPYELSSPLPSDAKSWSDSFVTSQGITGEKEYDFTVGGSKICKWPSLCAEFFNTGDSDELQNYLINESHYNVMMYEDYTSLTIEQKKMLARFIGSGGDQSKAHVDYKQALSRIQTILEDNFVYSEKALTGDDPVAAFLKKKKGCDVHYASIATLIFRYYGIPARYVEGYIITPEDIKGMKYNETVKIMASANHAWTEIYIDGFGWVPIEVTPEYYDKMEQPDLSKGLESNLYSDAFKKNRKIQQQNQVDADPDAEQKKAEIPCIWILVIVASLMLIIVIIRNIIRFIRKYLSKKRRIKSFQNPDIKEGICAIYQYMINENMDISDGARNIGEKAAFSPHPASEEERQVMLVELDQKERERREKKNNRNNDDGCNAVKSRRMRRRKNSK